MKYFIVELSISMVMNVKYVQKLMNARNFITECSIFMFMNVVYTQKRSNTGAFLVD